MLANLCLEVDPCHEKRKIYLRLSDSHPSVTKPFQNNKQCLEFNL